jgi:SAM-dependent methyltransferase
VQIYEFLLTCNFVGQVFLFYFSGNNSSLCIFENSKYLMTEINNDILKCCLCGGASFKIIPFRYSFKGRFLNGQKCKCCGLISIFPRPAEFEIEEMYSDDYFTVADKNTHHGTNDYISDIAKVDYAENALNMQRLLKGGNFLEVGCAAGSFLNALKNIGFNVTGVELSTFAANYGKEKYGINIINKPFDEALLGAELKENSFDAILMGDVLEHFTNPFKAMELSCRLLRKGGRLIVNVPGTLNLISSRMAFVYYRLTGSQKTMSIPPYHLTEFFPGTLKKMYLKAGFSTVEIIQKTKHPKTIPLRHSKMENFIKLSTQYPNYYLTRFFGIYGDRITGIGSK